MRSGINFINFFAQWTGIKDEDINYFK